MLAKQDSSAAQIDGKEGNTHENIFKQSFESLLESLETLHRASGRLQHASKKYCQEEFQVLIKWEKLFTAEFSKSVK